MKKLLFFLFLLAFAPLANAQKIGVDYPEIGLADGRILYKARVASFNGDVFRIEHRAGITRVAWSDMLTAWREAFPYEPEKAELAAKTERYRAEILKAQKETQKKTEAALDAQRQEQFAEQQRISGALARHQVVIGMTADKVRQCRGYPTRINRTTRAGGTSEQWVYYNYSFIGAPPDRGGRPHYESSSYVYLDNGVVTAIQD